MSDNITTSEQSPTITIETTYHTREGEKTETLELDIYQVENLLEMALRDSLDGVDARVIKNEIQARSK